jgi:protein-disulfide isomerase
MSKDTIEISKDSFYKGIIGILVVALIISVYTGGFGFNSGMSDSPTPSNVAQGNNNNNNNGNSGAGTVDPVEMKELIDDDSIKGQADAPVTIVEFSDYECPFCARFYSQTLQQIDEEYIQTGKVKLVYRDFPLSFHPQAQKAAEAAECAGEQGMYYEMHDMLFERGVSGGVTSFKAYAAEIGLNTADFDNCLDSGAMADEVKKDFADGQAAGIRGTPGFIINGEVISGALPFENFKQVIDAKLAEA